VCLPYTLSKIKSNKGIDVAEEIPSFRLSDELMQVWTNLIHNAIQAMSGRGN
jgi:signal transduction histidine kinase